MSWAQSPGTPPPGWYPDPSGSGRQRWWDGTRWTEHYAGGPQPHAQAYGYPPNPAAYPQQPAARAATKDNTPPPLFWAVPLAVVALIAGSIGTWVTVSVSGIGFSSSLGGLDEGGDGWLTLMAGVIAGVLLVIWVFERVVVLPIVAAIVSAVSAVIALYHLADPSTGTKVPFSVDVSVGWGVWVAFLASLLLTAAAIALAVQTGRRTA